MKKSVVICMILFLILSVSAGQKGETKVDSIVYDQGMQWKTFSSDKPVKTFTVQKDCIWFATESGLHYINMVKGNDKKDFAEIGSIPSTSVTAIATDASGNIWIGTEAGIALKTRDGFKIFTKETGLSDPNVNSVYAAPNGKIWFGTNSGACCYSAGTWTKYTASDGLCSDKVHSITIDKNNTVWFGTDKGISAFDGSKWVTHNMNNGLSWNDTKVIACDPKTNIIWAAVGDKDVNSFDGQTWKQYVEVVDGAIKCIMTDTHSRIWLGTVSGLVKFNGDEWVSDQDKIGIPANQTSQMYRDDHGNLWFGMEKGIMRVANPYPY
jgi:ligand-binding sensor domain-containing protein